MIMRYLCRVWKFSILRKNITEFLLCRRAILPPADRKTGTSAQQSGQSAAAGTAVSEASAKETVFAHAGVAEADVLFYRSHIDTDHGSSRYEIEFTAGGYEYDYEVDCMSGEILKFEKDKIR